MSILKIALTGGIACGKSSVCQILEKMGVATIDLDVIARKVVMPNTQGWTELLSQFGDGILNADQSINRGLLRQKLFKNQANKALIEKILHPKILQQMQIDIKSLGVSLVVIEVPLLVEQQLSPLFDCAIIVDCSAENQLKRLLKRQHINPALANKMLLTQANRQQRLALLGQLPTDIIKNNADLPALTKAVHSLMKKHKGF